jgi:hypothetical protein
MGETEPLDNPAETHGICAAHERMELNLLAIREARKSGLAAGHLRGRAQELCGYAVAAAGRMLVFAFPLPEAAYLFAGENHGMVIRGGLNEAPLRVAVQATHD